jgi:hypothetical protein
MYLQCEHCDKVGHDITHYYDMHLEFWPNSNHGNQGGWGHGNDIVQKGKSGQEINTKNNLNQVQGYGGLVGQGMLAKSPYQSNGYYPFGSKATWFNIKPSSIYYGGFGKIRFHVWSYITKTNAFHNGGYSISYLMLRTSRNKFGVRSTKGKK